MGRTFMEPILARQTPLPQSVSMGENKKVLSAARRCNAPHEARGLLSLTQDLFKRYAESSSLSMRNRPVHVELSTATFEGHAQTTEDGVEYWLARDLQQLLGYSEWRNFTNAIIKVKTACVVSGHRIPDTRPLADFAPTIILKAKDFATEITIHNAREHNMQRESEISAEHITHNRAVREILLSRGISPENLTPEEDIKKVERRLASEDKKALTKPDRLAGDKDLS